MKIAYAALVLFLASQSVLAQEKADSEFTSTILAKQNVGMYRVFVAKFIRSEEGIRALEISKEQSGRVEDVCRTGIADLARLNELMNQSKSSVEYKNLSRDYDEAKQRFRQELLLVLTYDQRKRFAQVSFQNFLSGSRSLEMYLHRALLPYLKMNQSQQTELQTAVNNPNVEYLEALSDLNEKYRQQILEDVGLSIREKVEPVVGEPWFRRVVRSKSVLKKDDKE